jgi:putative ABC transport system ATP-binding protein
LERNLLKYIWKHSRPQQAWLFVVILSSMPLYFMSLDLPKRIVNGPIQGNGFDSPGDVYHFLAFDLPYSQYFFGEPISVFSGFELSRTGTLIALCFAFLTMVFVNGWFKLYINTYKGRLGERLLRRLRYELFDRVLRYPVQKIRQVKPSEITSVIKDEVDPLSEFIGDAFSLPMFLGGQAITGLTFLFLQNYFFGILTLGIVLFQAWLVPRLRRRLLVLGRERQTSARRMAGRIGELVQSMDDVHLNDTSNLHRAQLSGMLGKIYHIRFELYQRKFAVKFINNFLIQFLAFLFYAVGGYFVITGRMDIGALVASIAAYKDLPTPIKGLID